ncbi:MAG: hypothetical protein BroJett014_30860 [Planctomycetota bacterium]|nr:hypothetical protein [Planctomycetota bacterium]GIK54113.1 MAG: hypothetical protein BroJett014_30860 [Planctomycetota bacterium]
MPEPARKQDPDQAPPEPEALPDASFNSDLGFDEGFGDLQPLNAPEPLTVRDVPISVRDVPLAEESLSEDADAPLDVQPDLDVEAPATGFDDAPAQRELPSEEEAEEAQARAQEQEQLRAALTQKLGELQVALKQAQDEAMRARDHTRELSEQLKRAPAPGEVTRLRAELEAAASARAMAEDDLRVARNEMELARAEMARLNALLVERQSAATPPLDDEREQEEARLRAALEEAQGAIARVEHANEELVRRQREADARAESLKQALAQARAETDARAELAARHERELALARNELAQMGDQAADVLRRSRELDDRQAELERVTRALAQAQMDLAEARGVAEGAQARIDEAEARAKAAEESAQADKKRADTAEREVKEARERLDSEAARSFRLSQRRIPALQNEIAAEHAQNMELRRKIEKLEAEKRVTAESQREAQSRAEELERALAAAKARLSDTEIIRAKDATGASSLADEEIARLAARLKASEDERKRLAARLGDLDSTRRAELKSYEARLQTAYAESSQRLDEVISLRKQARALAVRLGQAMKLAQLAAEARSPEEKKPVLDKIAEISRQSETIEDGAPAAAPSVQPVEPQPATHPDDEVKLERELDNMPDVPDFRDDT